MLTLRRHLPRFAKYPLWESYEVLPTIIAIRSLVIPQTVIRELIFDRFFDFRDHARRRSLEGVQPVQSEPQVVGTESISPTFALMHDADRKVLEPYGLLRTLLRELIDRVEIVSIEI